MVARVIGHLVCEDLEAESLEAIGVPNEVLRDAARLALADLVEGSL